MNLIYMRPRFLGLICGATAVALGIAYMIAGGAPRTYPLINVAALGIGSGALFASRRVTGQSIAATGALLIVLAFLLLLTAVFGVAAEGVSRWVSVGPLLLQVSLIVLPVMIVLFARRQDSIGTAGIMLAALALAAQPDRAMAGALAAGLTGLAFTDRNRLTLMAMVAALLAFGWTLIIPDMSPAVPFVDRIFFTSFRVHALAGLAVAAGAALLLMPAALGALRSREDRPVLMAFGGCWAGTILAAAAGNYPTPLVGYGGSAVLGYLLSVAFLPARFQGGSDVRLDPLLRPRRRNESSGLRSRASLR